MFNESIKSNCKKPYDYWCSRRRLVKDTMYQVDIDSTQSNNSPKNLIAAHPTAARLIAPSKNTNISIFDNLDV